MKYLDKTANGCVSFNNTSCGTILFTVKFKLNYSFQKKKKFCTFLSFFNPLTPQDSNPWKGELCGEGTALLEYYANQNDISPFLQDLA